MKAKRSNRNTSGKKKALRYIFGGVLIAFLLAGIYIVLNFNDIQGNFAHHVQDSALSNGRHNKQKKKASFDFGAVKPVSPSTLAYAYAHRRDYRAIGQIAIPKYNIDLNIYRGVGNVELNLGAGTMTIDQKMGKGNYSLAGHNMDDGRSFFSPLYTAKVNNRLNDATIMLTDYDMVYFYKLTQSTFITRYRTDLLENKPDFEKKPVISLFTCDYTGAGRLFVKGELTGYQKLSKASQYVQRAFTL